MKAITYNQYGSPEVLQLKEIEKPKPKSNEVLIQVLASSVTRYDCWARSCQSHTGLRFFMRLWYGFNSPIQPILGTELSGKIIATGKDVSRFKKGDLVFAFPGMRMGSYAEYICLPQELVELKPKNISNESAASVLQGALTALFFLEKANLKKNQKVLVIGASGSVGMFAVQIAKNLYRAEVTGVCSTSKIDYVKTLGADKVIDYKNEDYRNNGIKYDVIFDTFGTTTFKSTKSLTKRGTILYATYGLKQILQIFWLSLFSSKRAKSPLLKEKDQDLNKIKNLIEKEIIMPYIDKKFPIEKASAAHHYFENGQKTGSVIITLN